MLVDCIGIPALRPRPRVQLHENKSFPRLFLDMPEGRIFFLTPGPMRAELLGQLCVVWLDDGRVLGRRVHASAAGPELYDLVSLNVATLVGVRIIQAALVREVQSAGGERNFMLQQLLNRDPEIPHDPAVAVR